MKLARDTIYDSATKKTMEHLLVQMLRRRVELDPLDDKTFAVRLEGQDQLTGCRIWTDDWNSWKVHSSTILRLRRQRDMITRC